MNMMENVKRFFVSPLKNRLWQFCQTYHKNLEILEKYDNYYWLILDFNSIDGVEKYINSLPKNNKIIFLRSKIETPFHCSINKNQTAICGIELGGENIFSLDIDNFISDDTIYEFSKVREGRGLHQVSDNGTLGSFGRIAFNKNDFLNIHGYREDFAPAHSHDADLVERLRMSGVCVKNSPHYNPRAILNSKKDTVKNSGGMTYDQMIKYNSEVKKKIWKGPISPIPKDIIKKLNHYKRTLNGVC